MDKTDGKKEYVEYWNRVGPMLTARRHQELRGMTDESTARAFHALASLVDDLSNGTVRMTSGFVEQQQLFLRMRANDEGE